MKQEILNCVYIDPHRFTITGPNRITETRVRDYTSITRLEKEGWTAFAEALETCLPTTASRRRLRSLFSAAGCGIRHSLPVDFIATFNSV